MAKHLQREIEKLKKSILTLGALVENAVQQATFAIQDRDAELAQSVIDKDLVIDHEEVEVEEECLKILALYQPVATDLRFIISALKINNDLERIGDLAVNIAERAVFLAFRLQPDISFDFVGMAKKVQSMLKRSLDSLVNMDTHLAHQVCKDDDEVDDINTRVFEQVKEHLQNYPDSMESLIHLLSVSRHLERIADHATNIAEDVIYMVEGSIVRHQSEIYKDRQPQQ